MKAYKNGLELKWQQVHKITVPLKPVGHPTSEIGRMNVVVAHSEVNPNTRVANCQGRKKGEASLVGLPHVALLSVPFSTSVFLTPTHIIELSAYVFLR